MMKFLNCKGRKKLEYIFFVLSLFIWTYAKCVENVKKDNGENDLYLTNDSTSYHDIPSDCDLFGSNHDGHIADNITVNFTSGATFWINARVGFQRNLNPLDIHFRCIQNKPNGITIDGCNKKCGTKYFSHNHNACYCEEKNSKKSSLGTVRPCQNEHDGLCLSGHCIVYEKENDKESLFCDTYRFLKDAGVWIYKMQPCSMKLEFICDGGESKNNRLSSWFDAHQLCLDNGSHLLEKAEVLTPYEDGKVYWIAFFRRQILEWKSDPAKSVCVAARVNDNGILQPTTKFCNNSLPALCQRQKRNKAGRKFAENTILKGALIGTVGAVVCVVIIIIVALIIRKKKKCFCNQNIDVISVDHNEESKNLNEKQENMKNTGGSLPDLAAYSDPKHCLPKLQDDGEFQGMDNSEPLYESTDNLNCNALPNMTNAVPLTYCDPIDRHRNSTKNLPSDVEYAYVNSKTKSKATKSFHACPKENPYHSPYA